MAVLNTISYEDAVDLLNRKFDAWKIDPLNNAMKTSGLIRVNTVPAWTGATRRHKEVPVWELYASVKTEWGVTAKTMVQQGYSKDTYSRTFAKSIDITLEMRQLDKTRVYDSMNFLANVLPNREDLNLAMYISYWTSTSYTDQDGQTVDISTWDGLALFSSSHTLTGSSTTFRSILANNPAFSEWALELAEDALRTNTYTNLGEQVTCTADTIVTTDYPVLVNTVRRLIQSTAQISSPNEWVVNVYKWRYKHVILPAIDKDANGAKDSTKKAYWLLADSKITSWFHDVYMAPEMRYPSKWNNGEDIDTLDWTFTVCSMHDNCIVSPRWMMFSKWTWEA